MKAKGNRVPKAVAHSPSPPTRRAAGPKRKKTADIDTAPADATYTGAADTRALILSEAARLLREQGYAAVSLRQIAAAAGIKAGSIYYHFASKEDLLFHVLKEGLRVIIEEVQLAMSALPANAPFDVRLATAIRGHLHGLLRMGDFSTANIRIYGQVPEAVRSRHKVAQRQYAEWWDAFLRQAVEEGAMPANLNIGMTRVFVIGALNWTVEWHQPGKGSFDELVDQIVAIVSHGLVRT